MILVVHATDGTHGVDPGRACTDTEARGHVSTLLVAAAAAGLLPGSDSLLGFAQCWARWATRASERAGPRLVRDEPRRECGVGRVRVGRRRRAGHVGCKRELGLRKAAGLAARETGEVG